MCHRKKKLTAVSLIYFSLILLLNADIGPVDTCLLKIDLPERAFIFELAGFKISVLQEFPGYVLAETAEKNLATLKKKGIRYELLDTNPAKNLYYLVLVRNKEDLVILERYGKILLYDGQTALLKVTARDIDALYSQRFRLKKLRKSPVRLKKEPQKTGDRFLALRAAAEANPIIQEMLDQASQDAITESIQTLQDFLTRYSTTAGCLSAGEYIFGHFEALGLDTEYHHFTDGWADNVIATHYGMVNPEKIYIICAHYDSTSSDPLHNAPGADDNASGVAAVLEAARVLSEYQFNCTIRFICFAGEEQGLDGSSAYAEDAAAAGDQIMGVIDFDMIGYADAPGEDLEVIGNNDSEWLVDHIIAVAGAYAALGTRKIIDPSIIYSDHSPFWDEGYSALCGIEDYYPPNPHYHTTSDTLATLDLDFATEVVKTGIAATAALAKPYSSGVMLLFDTSGSMSWAHDGTVGVPPEEQRLSLAREASYPFMHMLNDFFPDKVTFGIATFPSHPATACEAQVITPMTLVTDETVNTAITITIPGLYTEDNTPLLAGVEAAAGAFGWESNKAIVLLSDGYHNCPTFIETGDPEFTSLAAGLTEQEVKVYTIGFAKPSDIDHHFLDELAAGTGGEFRDVTSTPGFDPSAWNPATDLQATYKSILADGLGLETPVDPAGVIAGGETVIHKVSLNEQDQKVSFFLGWATPRQGRLDFTVTASDGSDLSPGKSGISTHEGKTYKIITVDNSILKQKDKIGPTPWKVAIQSKGMTPGEREYYQYSVTADSGLKMQAGIAGTSYQTGEPMALTVRITEQHKPVLGLTDVKMHITTPDEGWGNWFAKHTISEEELKQVNRGEERLPPVMRKAIYLAENRKVKLPGSTAPVTLALHDDGTHGDRQAGDGIYANQFAGVKKEGTCSFSFQAAGLTSKGNPFTREKLIQKYITVNTDPESIVVDAAALPSAEAKRAAYKITITPKDTLGNYLGPGFSGAIRLDTTRGSFSAPLKDNLDGSYSRILFLDTAVSLEDVDLAIDVRGSKKTIRLADKLKKGFNLCLYLGADFQANNATPGFSAGLGFGYDLTPRLAVECLAGYNRFPPGYPLAGNTCWWNITPSLRYELDMGAFLLYAQSGPGFYIPQSGSPVWGIEGGGGIIFPINNSISIDARYNSHYLFTGANHTAFSAVWFGILLGF